MVRIKYRYLLINFLYPDDDKKFKDSDLPWTVKFRRPTSDKLGMRALMDLMRGALEKLFGDYGAGMVAPGLIVKYLSAATSTAIIRAPRAHYRMLWAALTSVTELPNGEKCTIQVVRVSGTIRKSEEAAIRQARRSIVLAQGGAAALLPKDTIMPDSIEDDDLDLDDED